MTEELRFRALRLSNWKNFATVDFAIPDRLFLVGPNASGKSNLLDSLRFLRDLASSGGGLQEAVNRRGGVTAIRRLAARQYPDIEIHVKLEEVGGPQWQYLLAVNQDNQRRPLVKKERVVEGGREILSRPRPEDQTDPARLTQTYLEQVNANREFRDLTTFFASIRYLHIVPQLVREPDRSVGPAYSSRLIEYVERHWRPRVAANRSDSLRRAIECLQRLVREAPRVPGVDML
ncbi:MAG: AAA family ATPase [Planctomycetes bacterium]|nr:AAA family ATPase [Planctomycetota bacterium]